jgi:glucosylceramidase
VESSGGPAGIESVAFVNPDGTVVIVVLNTGDGAIDFGVRIGDESVGGHLPAHAIQTYLGSPHA